MATSMYMRLICGHVLDVLPTLEVESVNLVVTSPPYWGLRDYGSSASTVWGGSKECEHEWYDEGVIKGSPGRDTAGGFGGKDTRATQGWSKELAKDKSLGNTCVKCGGWRGQLGLEPHPSMYIEHLVEVCRGLKRVLRSDGCFYLNLGDTYFGGKGQSGRKDHNLEQRRAEGRTLQRREWTLNRQDAPQDLCKQDGKWLQPKQLLGMPWRVAISLQNDGWILRNANVWHKPNAMPSSVKDRLNNTYELVFHFAKSRRYFYDLDAIRVPHKGMPSGNIQRKENLQPRAHELNRSHFGVGIPWTPTEKGKNPGDVLKRDGIPGQTPQSIRKHSGYFGPNGECLVDFEKGKNPGDFWTVNTKPFKGAHFAVFPPKLIEPIIKSSCPKGGVVLDPFVGSGTTMRVARDLFRSCIGIDAVEEYCDIAKKRVFGKQYLDHDVEYVYENGEGVVCPLIDQRKRGESL